MTRPTAVVSFEGVLQHPDADTRCLAGITLYTSLLAVFDVVLLCSQEVGKTRLWCMENGVPLGEAGIIQDSSVSLSPKVDRVWAINHLRTEYGYAVAMVVEADPWIAKQLFKEGYNVSLFMSPAYARPEWRPDYTRGITPWADIQKMVTEDNIHRNSDERLRETAR